MPRKPARKTKKTRGRKPVRRRRRAQPRTILSGFPSQKLVKLRYVDSRVTLNAGSDSFIQQVYRANSVFDPDFSGLGHQPMGFDQWAAIYHRYTVMGAKITVTSTPIDTGTIVPARVGITLSGDSNPLANYADIDNILESKLSTGYRVIGNATSLAAARPVTIYKNFSAKKFFGVVDVVDGSAHTALVTTNPAKDAYFGVWAAAIDASDPGTISLSVQIDYIVMFREAKNLAGS